MKTLTTAVLVLLLAASTAAVFAQKKDIAHKSIFTEFPGEIEISSATLKNTLVAKPGQTVSIPFNDRFVFRGKVVSNEMKYADLQSMLVRSEQYANTLFQLSRISDPATGVKYVGRIISPDALEVYEIRNDMADNYRLQRVDLDRVLQDCRY